MLSLLALLFFSLSTSVTALPMNQPDELGHHPDAPIPPAVLAFSGDHVPRMELPSRSFGCWTPMGKVSLCSFNVMWFKP
jgi:hypothetical protein